MHRFVPPAQFEQHPAYFAERNGMRVPDQLCLSNPAVLRITVDSLRAMMQRKRFAKYWSVSQMDNFNFCQCAQCHRTDSIEGSPSGRCPAWRRRTTASCSQCCPRRPASTRSNAPRRKENGACSVVSCSLLQ